MNEVIEWLKRLVMPFSIRAALVQCGRPDDEAAQVEAMCRRLRIGESGQRVLAQCCATGRIKADDLNQIFDWAPGVVADPQRTRAAVREAPILWPDFVGHLYLDSQA